MSPRIKSIIQESDLLRFLQTCSIKTKVQGYDFSQHIFHKQSVRTYHLFSGNLLFRSLSCLDPLCCIVQPSHTKLVFEQNKDYSFQLIELRINTRKRAFCVIIKYLVASILVGRSVVSPFLW